MARAPRFPCVFLDFTRRDFTRRVAEDVRISVGVSSIRGNKVRRIGSLDTTACQ